ncbi:hypothetical protein J7E81_05870 [Bacillus sp. ISL-18]|uniref:DUF6230 family protein n=1 Tax=Bacillus sp. ISL-18 TaxID=2819118 RepID=UPI001BE5CB7D|nr:DUF6230 family protein [Bacillus sp. ISL-18]MBT2654776.1 hypothetical protein [Bacillus sp. ISL-18]
MWWKRKPILLCFCILLLMLTLRSLGNPVYAADKSTDEGFIIEADRVVGSGMNATIVKQETTQKNGQLMLRIQYQSATIYGMRLTKQIDTPTGSVTISLKANGPVTVKNMTVDTTAISFTGACINAAEVIPEVGMENVVMAAHYMKSVDSLIEQLTLTTLSGKTNSQKPGTIKVLQDLSLLPLKEVDKEIEKITTGHLPLMCEDSSKIGEGTNSDGSQLEPIKDTTALVTKPLEPVTGSLEPVLDPLEPVTKAVEPVLKPLEPVTKAVEPVLKPLEPVTKAVEPVLKPLEPVTKAVEPVLKPLEPVTKAVEPVVKGDIAIQSVCERLRQSKGVINKQLALELFNEGLNKKLPLSKVCQNDPTLANQLQKMETGLLKSLGLFDLLGRIKLEDPVQQLTKMREKIDREKDGEIIFKP